MVGESGYVLFWQGRGIILPACASEPRVGYTQTLSCEGWDGSGDENSRWDSFLASSLFAFVAFFFLFLRSLSVSLLAIQR